MFKKIVATATVLLLGAGLSLTAVSAANADPYDGSGSGTDSGPYVPPTKPADAAASTTVTPPTCASGAVLTLHAVNAAWKDDDGDDVTSVPAGSGDFSLTAYATYGHTFSDGTTTQHFTGTLPPKLSSDNPYCVPPSQPKASVEVGDCTVGPYGASVGVTFLFDNSDSSAATTFTIPSISLTQVVPAGQTAEVGGTPVGGGGASYDVFANGTKLTTLTVKSFAGCDVTPGDPTSSPAVCQQGETGKVGNGTIWVDLKTGLIYTIDGPGVHISPVTQATNYLPVGEYTVSVTAADGFILTGDAKWPFTLDIYPPTHGCATPTLFGSTATGVCLNNAPWIQYDVTLNDPDNQADNHAASLILAAGANTITLPLAAMTDKGNGTWTASGKVLWPGAAVDALGNATDWPGWKLVGGHWVSDPSANFGWVRTITQATLSVNPELVVDLAYPPVTPDCNDNPPPTPPTLAGSTTTGVCLTNSPWIFYDVTMTDPDNQADNHTASLIMSDGTHTTTVDLGALTNKGGGIWKVSGQALWPGASVDLGGNATGWPGWSFIAGAWAETPDANFGWTRAITTATLSVNPSLTVDLQYPPARPDCNDSPPDLPTDALIPTNATHTDEYCTSAGTFAGSITVGQVAGVNYLGFTNYFLDGVPMTKATTYLPAGTYHVTATVKDPADTLDGPSSWDITIAGVDQTQCDELKTLALTGSDPSGWFLFAGGLLLIGVALGAAPVIRRRLNED